MGRIHWKMRFLDPNTEAEMPPCLYCTELDAQLR